ncbi:HNH endonuclease [Azospirillum canadense]|uniref:HNH endonuclease n=1 Tax=Azospirillum canadense TaxID=403962 RepID=UPI002226B87D|nr:hypothetical protein [Azospirillum canadense]MCW2243618.1 hypothetical protein [Azospirillum canadense]
MPIRPEQRALYPKDWRAISLRIRTERAGGRCEFCKEAINGQLHPVTGSKVVLTVAHLNHDPTDCRDENLAAMCQKCHLTYDAALHRENAARTRCGRLAQLNLLGMLSVGLVCSGQIGNRPDTHSLKKIGEFDSLVQFHAVGHQSPTIGLAPRSISVSKLDDCPSLTNVNDFKPHRHGAVSLGPLSAPNQPLRGQARRSRGSIGKVAAKTVKKPEEQL